MFDLKAVGNFLRSLPVVARLFAKREYLPDDVYERKIAYHGWIKAYPEQRGILEGLGAYDLEYNEDGSYFGCKCGKATMEALMLGFPTFWPGCFTACIGDEQLPHGLQEYWHYPNVLVSDGDVVDGKWKCPRCGAVMKVERRRCGNCMAYRTFLDVDIP